MLLTLFLLMGLVLTAHASPPLLPPMNGAPADFAPRRAGAEVNATLRMAVTNEGLYTISQPMLIAAGLRSNDLIGAQIRLYCTTQEVGICVTSDGLWTSSDALFFFGQAFGNDYTDSNIYWLGVGGVGKRMPSRHVMPVPAVPDTVTCPWQSRYHHDTVWMDLYRTEDESFNHWFAKVLLNTVTKTMVLATDQVAPSSPASITATVYGFSSDSAVATDHCTRVWVNDIQVADLFYDGQNSLTGTSVFAGTVLAEANSVSFRQMLQSGVSVDQAFLQEFSIAYTRRLTATNGSLIFQGQAGTNNYKVGGFLSNTNMTVVDVSDPASPTLLDGYQVTNVTGSYAVRFGETRSDTGRYAICQSSAFKTVSEMRRVFFRNLASTNRQADYLVICPTAFRAPVYRLLKQRYRQGLKVAVVPLPDIYNEFSYGIADAAAIKQFIGYAFHHWQGPPPRYVLLAGNGSYDPKGNLIGSLLSDSYAAPNIIPVHMGPSRSKWTALDGWYAQVNGPDKVIDVALGRIPVESEAVLSNVVNKIIALETAAPDDWRRDQALLVADVKDGSTDFKAACETIRTSYLVPAGFGCTTNYDGELTPSQVRQATSGTINDGVLIVCYLGHGALDQWSSDNVFNIADVNALGNSFFPLVCMLTCENGNFQNPTDYKSMVEGFLEQPNRGASACMASTAPVLEPSSEFFAHGVFQKLVTERTRRIGDAALSGYAELFKYNPITQELLYLEVFGDPAMILNSP